MLDSTLKVIFRSQVRADEFSSKLKLMFRSTIHTDVVVEYLVTFKTKFKGTLRLQQI